MRTIVRTRDKNGDFHKFSFETSPLIDQDEQINKVLKQENIDHEVIDWQYFDAHEIGLKNKPTKKYFTVTDNETTLGVFEYTNNQDADSLIMQIVCEHLNADDCVTNQGFYVEDYKHKPYKITGTHWEELSDKYEFEIFIEQVHLYTK